MLNVQKNLESGRLSEGELVRKFEQSLESEFGMKNCVAVNSGTSALHLALILAGVGEDDEVILPAQTFVATGMAVLYCGAKPVFADIGMDGNIDLEDVSRKITDKTKAVICVSWGGNPCDVGGLAGMCAARRIYLIQDNAHALGATYYDKSPSVWGDFSCYSFQSIKELTTGDGGMLSCFFDDNYKRARRLRWFGIDRERDLADDTGERQYNLEEIGYKYHMNDYSAALGLGNLVGFKKRQARRLEIAKIYDNAWPLLFSGKKKEGCSYWLYDILVHNRSDFLRAMKNRGIPVSVVHQGIDRNDIFGGKQDLENQRHWDEHHVCLPIHSSLTDEAVQKVVEGVLKGW